MKLSFSLSTIIAVTATVPGAVLAAKGGGKGKITNHPSSRPSGRPSSRPSSRPSVRPSTTPSSMPSQKCDVLDKSKALFTPGMELCYGIELNTNEETYLLAEFESLSQPYSSCLSSETDVRNAINANKELIILCPGVIKVTSPIVMDYKRFDMRCLEEPSAGVPACTFDGQGTSQLFKAQTGGENVQFYGIGFINGRVTANLSGGAAIDLLNAGSLVFDQCLFKDNVSDYNGGALSIGFLVKVSVVNCKFINNKSGKAIVTSLGRGGAIYFGSSQSLSVVGTEFSGNQVIPASTSGTDITKGVGPNIFRAYGAAAVTCGAGNTFDTTAIVTQNALLGGLTTSTC